MSDVVTAADAARAAIAAATGAAPVAIVMAVPPHGDVLRIILPEAGPPIGTLPDAGLMDAALRLARAALAAADDVPVLETNAIDGADWLLLAEAHRAPEHLIIVGAGHIAVPLAHLGRVLGFRVTVLDDREEFTGDDRFDDDVVVIRSDFAVDPFAGLIIDASCYVALVTRGHRWDFDCLRRLVGGGARPRYIGMIGSRRRVRAAFHALLEAGTPRDVLAAIRAPIGLEIQAETPAEIAVSIAAELVAVRRGAEAGSISARERVLDRFLSTGDPHA
jgi:xanthine dehydrogenase accessory factor